jgi:hypothetical protein
MILSADRIFGRLDQPGRSAPRMAAQPLARRGPAAVHGPRPGRRGRDRLSEFTVGPWAAPRPTCRKTVTVTVAVTA